MSRPTELTDRDLELIEVALDAAVSATSSRLTPTDTAGDLNQEYRQALTHVQRFREEQASLDDGSWTDHYEEPEDDDE